MPAISTAKVQLLWAEGNAPRWVALRIKDFDTGDTFDTSTYFSGTVEVATFITSQTTTPGTVTSTTAAVITLTAANTSSVTGYLLCRGQASTGYVI